MVEGFFGTTATTEPPPQEWPPASVSERASGPAPSGSGLAVAVTRTDVAALNQLSVLAVAECAEV